MFSAPFSYHRASSLGHVHQLLAEHPGATLLAGGHSLIPLLKLRLAAPDTVIDIGRLPELRGISVLGGVLRIGAMSTHAEVAASDLVQRACPALAEAAGMVGDQQVRNRGTIGGNVAHADPASDLPTVLQATNADFVIGGPSGERRVAAADFFLGLMTTALASGDILTAVEVPAAPPGNGAAYVKFSHPASRYAVIGVAATITTSGGTCQAAGVAIGGLVPAAIRLSSVEQAMVGKPLSPETVSSAAAKTTGDLGAEIIGDLFASSEYRRAMAPIYVQRALAAAVARAR